MLAMTAQPRPRYETEEDDWTQFELLIRASQVAFPPTGELGIGIKVEKDGLVVVNQIKTVKGYAELTGVALSPGDILVAVDRRPVVDQPFSEVMRLLQETKATRPTQLDFLHVDAYVSADDAVDQWLQYRHNKYPTEGEFDVYFAPYQLTGIRLVESYLMTNPLKLAHVDNAIYASLQQSDHALVDRLLNKVIVRIGTHSVLGAPVPEVTALLYDPATFPKDIWLASADDLKEDYHVLRLTEEAQLIWFCFVPEELMMEVPAVSYAACSRDSNEDLHVLSPRTERRDGVKTEQYLMAINEVPTLRISAASFSEEKSGRQPDSSIDVVTRSLDMLLEAPRVLRFRDLRVYRQEMKANKPLSPWKRRRKSHSWKLGRDIPANGSNNDLSEDKHPLVDAKLEPSNSNSEQAIDNPTTIPSQPVVSISLKPRNFFRLLLEELHTNNKPLQEEHGDCQQSTSTSFRRRSHGLNNCEGERDVSILRLEKVKTVIIPDNQRSVGIQLETDVLTKYTVFKQFVREDSLAMSCRKIVPGDALVSINDVPVEEIPTDKLIHLLQHASSANTESRNVRFARKKSRSRRITSMLSDFWNRKARESPPDLSARRASLYM